MKFRRIPRHRRYAYLGPDSTPVQENKIDLESTENDPESVKKEIENIPLPNENENTIPVDSKDARNSRPMFLNNFFKNIHADEIILLGLIFILIQERLEDDFLLIVLIYLLLAGRD